MSDKNFALVKETAAKNLYAWKESGVVKTLKYYTAEDVSVCLECKKFNGSIIKIEEAKLDVNLPPLSRCVGAKCRCYFRPCDISVA